MHSRHLLLSLLLSLLLLVLKLRWVKLALVGHEGRRVHHASSSVWVVHRKAVAIVGLDGVVHPSAHRDHWPTTTTTAMINDTRSYAKGDVSIQRIHDPTAIDKKRDESGIGRTTAR